MKPNYITDIQMNNWEEFKKEIIEKIEKTVENIQFIKNDIPKQFLFDFYIYNKFNLNKNSINNSLTPSKININDTQKTKQEIILFIKEIENYFLKEGWDYFKFIYKEEQEKENIEDFLNLDCKKSGNILSENFFFSNEIKVCSNVFNLKEFHIG